MLERRAGEDNFKRLLQRLLAVSRNAASSPGESMTDSQISLLISRGTPCCARLSENKFCEIQACFLKSVRLCIAVG